MLRNSIRLSRAGLNQTNVPLHLDHCLLALREDIMCNADDTPRYTGGHHKQPGSGSGQFRMCRDWRQLEKFAVANTACYETPEIFPDGKGQLYRYKHCPDGSKPWVGLDDDDDDERVKD